MAIDTTDSTDSNQWTSEVCTGPLVHAMLIREHLIPSNHEICMAEGKYAAQDCKDRLSTPRLDQFFRILGNDRSAPHMRDTDQGLDLGHAHPCQW